MNRDTETEKLLCAHPGVREAAVLRDTSGATSAFVVANDEYVWEELGSRTAESNAVNKWLKAYDLSQLTKKAMSAPAAFNTLGWNSSYTRQPIPAEEMQEWVEATVADIVKFAPRRVYEIGCGTGLLLMRIAPGCQYYCGVDFSPAVLARLNEQLQSVPGLKERVRIDERQADNFVGLDDESFDTVVLSSVVQYFPGAAYLTRVLENAVKLAKPGGRVYVGDVRSLPLLRLFSSSVELYRAADELTVEQLLGLIEKRMDREQELVLSPAFFLMLQRRLPEVAEVEIRPIRGRARNEMTGYRYQAILHMGAHKEVPREVEFCDWNSKWTLKDIRAILRKHPRDIKGIKQIHNRRIKKDVRAMSLLRTGDRTCTAGELRHKLLESPEEGIHPQDLFDLENESLGFRVFLSWSACRHDGSYDAVFVPSRYATQESAVSVGWPRPDAREFVHLTNGAGQRRQRNELIALLKCYWAQNQSEITPRNITLVDALPRGQEGGYDTEVLLAAMDPSREY